ncbi:DUF3617 domain-containing protein [Erythrobacter alti]|uniref:DUF3617 domain-containing protein n=1 Tax=Erythrobacter alti TaxID=1896145 RepID=UPI0030F3F25C
MNRPAIFIPLIATAIVAPVVAISAQEAVPNREAVDPAQDNGEDFPWPDFIETDPLPGRYRMTFTIEEMSFPGLEGDKDGQGMADAMREVMEPEVNYTCLAGPPDRSNWREEFGGEDCTTNYSRIVGDSFDTAIQCTQPSGGEAMNARFTGTAGEGGMDMLMTMQMQAADMGKMRMKMRMLMERVGECDADEQSAINAPAAERD